MKKFLLFLGCMVTQTAQPPVAQPVRRIVIFVHGSFIAARPVRGLFIKHDGLCSLEQLREEGNLRYLAITRTLCDTNKELYSPDSVYVYGWSGKLSHGERMAESRKLAAAIANIVANDSHVHITLITHSHGGNVALGMASLDEQLPFTIDRLVLLACPVLEATCHAVHDPLFVAIYAFHSHADLTQVADMQYFHNDAVAKKPIFAQRHFPADCRGRVVEVRIARGKRDIGHVEFITHWFFKRLMKLVHELEQSPEQAPRNKKGTEIFYRL